MMPRFKVGDTVSIEGRRARVVWLSENPNEIEAMDEYIVEFEDKHRQFIVSSTLGSEETQTIQHGKRDRDSCHT
jgi:hypothetical protein